MNSKKRRRVQLQDLILLLIRTVVPGVLVFALARPLLRPEAGAGPDQTAKHVVIVLDGTYSMGQSIGQTTAFEMAQAMAQDIVRGLPKQTEVSLVFLGRRPEILKERTLDHDSVHDAIARARVSGMADAIADAIESVDALLAGSGEVYSSATCSAALVGDLTMPATRRPACPPGPAAATFVSTPAGPTSSTPT